MIRTSVALKKKNSYEFETLQLVQSKLKALCHQAAHLEFKAQKETSTLQLLLVRPLQVLKFFQQELHQ